MKRLPHILAGTMLSVSLIYQYWLHTEAFYKFPKPIEFIFNTPSHHRVHHGSNVRYLDRNHGATLIIWDRLFGTFSEEITEEPVTYGLTKNIETNKVLKVAFGEYAAMCRDVKRAERWMGGEDRWRGGAGPVDTCNGNNMRNPLYRAFIAAGEEAGYGLTEDFDRSLLLFRQVLGWRSWPIYRSRNAGNLRFGRNLGHSRLRQQRNSGNLGHCRLRQRQNDRNLGLTRLTRLRRQAGRQRVTRRRRQVGRRHDEGRWKG